MPESTIPLIVKLSDAQLAAYNNADIDAFCACYHDEVRVLDGQGNVTLSGMDEFRPRYAKLFESCREVRAGIVARLQMGNHIVEHEAWQRIPPGSDELETGFVIVRYTEKDGKIWLAEFLK